LHDLPVENDDDDFPSHIVKLQKAKNARIYRGFIKNHWIGSYTEKIMEHLDLTMI